MSLLSSAWHLWVSFHERSFFVPNFLTFCKQQQIYYSGSQLTSRSMVKTSSWEEAETFHSGFGPMDCSGFSFLLCLPTPTPPEMNGGNRPAPEPVMVFWFHFPISSLSHFDKVTNCCHLQHPTPFTQAHPNAIINMKYSAQTEENISVYCSEIKPGLRCQLLSASSRAKKMKYLPRGLLIPHLFVLQLQFSRTRLSQLLLRTRTTRWKEKCEKSLFCLTSLIHSNRPDLQE